MDSARVMAKKIADVTQIGAPEKKGRTPTSWVVAAVLGIAKTGPRLIMAATAKIRAKG